MTTIARSKAQGHRISSRGKTTLHSCPEMGHLRSVIKGTREHSPSKRHLHFWSPADNMSPSEVRLSRDAKRLNLTSSIHYLCNLRLASTACFLSSRRGTAAAWSLAAFMLLGSQAGNKSRNLAYHVANNTKDNSVTPPASPSRSVHVHEWTRSAREQARTLNISSFPRVGQRVHVTGPRANLGKSRLCGSERSRSINERDK